MVHPATDVTPNASPTAHIAIIQRANVVCLVSNLMAEVYEQSPAMAVPEGTAHAVGTPRAEILLSRVHPRDTACPDHFARRVGTLRERRHNSQTQLWQPYVLLIRSCGLHLSGSSTGPPTIPTGARRFTSFSPIVVLVEVGSILYSATNIVERSTHG
jgi:hypothetical protein